MSGAAQVRRSPGAEGDPAPRARQRQAHRPLFAESSSQSLIEFHEVAALAAIAFLGALVFGITGFGAALVTIPLATRLVPLKFALALFAISDLSMALRLGFENPRNAVRAEWLIVLRISGDVLMRAVAAMLLVSGSSLVWRALG
jgi:hypothetical protein